MREEYREKLLADQNLLNYQHMSDVSLLMIAVSVLMLLQHRFFPQEGELPEFTKFYVLLYGALAGLGILFVLVRGISRFSQKILSEPKKKMLLQLYLYLLATLFIGLTWVDIHYTMDLSGYIIIILFISTIIWQSARDFAIISGFSLLLLILSFLQVEPYHKIEFQNYIQAVIYYILSWVLYTSLFGVRTENFLNRIHLEGQYRMLESESATDPLTSLYNRRYMKEELQKELARSERSGRPFSIVLLDIDHFKKVNETYGHITGDDTLREMARILREAVRLSDKVFRFGGEEFLILLPESRGDEAFSLAERIREKVEHFPFTGLRRHLTISLGVAQSGEDSTMDYLISMADKGLYTAKKKGRNRVVRAGEGTDGESGD